MAVSLHMRPIVLILIAINVWIYGIELAGGPRFCDVHGFVPAHASVGTALSSMFLHDPSTLIHLGGNMAFLLVFGTLVERDLGSIRFLCLYMAAGLAGCAFHMLVDPSSTSPLVGASGAVFGVLAACAMLRPRTVAFVAVFVLMNLVGFVFPDAVGMHGVSVGCHVGGFAVGFVMMRVVFAGKLQEVTS